MSSISSLTGSKVHALLGDKPSFNTSSTKKKPHIPDLRLENLVLKGFRNVASNNGTQHVFEKVVYEYTAPRRIPAPIDGSTFSKGQMIDFFTGPEKSETIQIRKINHNENPASSDHDIVLTYTEEKCVKTTMIPLYSLTHSPPVQLNNFMVTYDLHGHVHFRPIVTYSQPPPQATPLDVKSQHSDPHIVPGPADIKKTLIEVVKRKTYSTRSSCTDLPI